MAEWLTVPCVQHGQSWVRTPEPRPMLRDMSADTWIKKAQLPCWPLYSQQVSHQKWIWRICCVQARKHASEGIHPGFETQCRHHQKTKIRVSVAPRKELMSSKNFKKNSRRQHYSFVICVFFNMKSIQKHMVTHCIFLTCWTLKILKCWRGCNCINYNRLIFNFYFSIITLN